MIESSSSSALRFRHNATSPCASNDTGGVPPKIRSSTTTIIVKGCDISQTDIGDNSSTSTSNSNSNNNRNRGRSRIMKSWKTQKSLRPIEEFKKIGRRKEEDQSLRHLMSITAILSVLVLVGLISLACLVMIIDPDLQYHLPHLQKYASDDKRFFFPAWHYKWSKSSQREEAITIAYQSDDASTLNLDAPEIDKEGSDFTVLSGEEHDNDSIVNEHRDDPISPPLSPRSPRYAIPNSMAHIGDKSEQYARLRQDWDERYPPDSPERSLRAVKDLVATGNGLSSIYNRLQPPPVPFKPSTQNIKNDDKATLDNSDNDDDKNLNYDIYDCPDDPPPGYPRDYKTIDILKHWPPTQSLPVGSNYHNHSNNTTNKYIKEGNDTIDASGDDNVAIMAHLGLCVFDYSRDYEKAMRYRSQEMPFVVRNDPSLAETVERWNDENYRRKLFGSLYYSDSDSVNGHDNNYKTKGDDDVNDRIRMIYHRAEESITNQVLFRHARKKKSPQFNIYPSSNKKEKEKTKNEGQHDMAKGSELLPIPPPTKLVAMTYDQWYERAMEKEDNSIIDTETGIQYYDANLNGNKSLYYYYFRMVGCGEKKGCERNSTEFLFDEMPFFQPWGQPKTDLKSSRRHGLGHEHRQTSPEDVSGTSKAIPESFTSQSRQEILYLVEPEKQRGIHCRFGMPGMIAVNHYDASRNMIAVLGGSRRYIVSRPEQCPNLGLYPEGHPSSRHSKVDWTTAFEDYQNLANHDNDNGEESKSYSSESITPSWINYRKSLSRLANNATSTEVVLQAGDVLYLPTYWFHYIISLTTNMQCNTRSGHDGRNDQIMADCGFLPPQHKNKKTRSESF